MNYRTRLNSCYWSVSTREVLRGIGNRLSHCVKQKVIYKVLCPVMIQLMLRPVQIGNAITEITDSDTDQRLAHAETSNSLIRPLHATLC